MNQSPVTPDTLQQIRRNAGRVPPSEIARSLGWTEGMLRRVAHDKQIDLTMIPLPPSAPPSPRESRDGARSQHLTVSLLAYDMDAIESVASATGLRRARVVTRIIENARARDLLFELAKLPAPMPGGRV